MSVEDVANSCAAQVVFTVVACWLASGIVFGFAALKPVLISEGVYRELCTPEELEADVEVCYAQDLRVSRREGSVGTVMDESGEVRDDENLS